MSDLREGAVIGRYRIECKLGEGGMGSVWRARDELLDRTIALKFLADSCAMSRESRERFLREARAASHLDHPGMATVFDAGEEGERVFIAFQFVDGQTLQDRMRAGPLDPGEALRIARDAAAALSHAHEHGVLHRDVSARNIMLASDGSVVLVDFGLAIIEDQTRLTRAGAAAGTAPYMAPETVRGEKIDRRTDVYSLGAVMYQMFAGRPPFTGERLESLLYSAVHTEPDPPSRHRPDIPPAIDALVLRALEKDPDHRFADMVEFHSAIEAVARTLSADDKTIETQVAPVLDFISSPRTREIVRKRRRQAFLVGIALALLVVSIVGMIRHGTFSRSSLTAVNARAAPPASLAVLPLRLVGTDTEKDRYIADGITQSLISRLTRVGSFQVTPWVTSSRYDATNTPLESIFRELGVDRLIEGEYREINGELSVRLSLIDGSTGRQVWSDEVRGAREDLFDTQNRLAMKVARSIVAQGLSPDQERKLLTRKTYDVNAYLHYLEASKLRQSNDRQDRERALSLYRRSLRIDKSLAESHVGIGSILGDQWFLGQGPASTLRNAREHYRTALEIDPQLVAAYRGLIWNAWLRGKSDEILSLGESLATLESDAIEVELGQAEAYFLGGLEKRAIPLLSSIIRRDKANAAAYWIMTMAATFSGQYELAIRTGRTFLDRFGEDYEVRLWVGVAHFERGDLERARENYEVALKLVPDDHIRDIRLHAGTLYTAMNEIDLADQIWLDQLDLVDQQLAAFDDNSHLHAQAAFLTAALGDIDRHEEEVKRTIEIDPDNGINAFELAVSYYRVGDNERAEEMLELALKSGYYLLAAPHLRRTFGLPSPLPDGMQRYLEKAEEILVQRSAHLG